MSRTDRPQDASLNLAMEAPGSPLCGSQSESWAVPVCVRVFRSFVTPQILPTLNP